MFGEQSPKRLSTCTNPNHKGRADTYWFKTLVQYYVAIYLNLVTVVKSKEKALF